jgi:DNA-binding CsgD family transcriptional regulator
LSCQPRQEEIVALMAQGRTPKQVAHDLGISVRTVEKILINTRREAAAPNIGALMYRYGLRVGSRV